MGDAETQRTHDYLGEMAPQESIRAGARNLDLPHARSLRG